MKQILTILTCLVVLCFCSTAVLAQKAQHGSTHMATKSMAKVYSCEACHVASMKAGKCPGCKAEMKPINASVTYSCADCHTTSMKAGKCPKCMKPMQKMAMTFACEMCHTTALKAGKCPKCHMDMKKMTMKVVG